MFNIVIDEEVLKEVEKFIENDKTMQFMLSNTTDIAVPAFIMESVFKAVAEAREKLAAADE